jgi:predicted permease
MSRRKRVLKDLDRDIEEHIAMETQDNIERGMQPEEARYAALRKFGNIVRAKEETRAVWSFIWLEQLVQDVRFGVRMLRQSPGFAAMAILTLALGIGANTAIFSLIDAVMLRALPARNPSQLVLLQWSARNSPKVNGYMSSGDCANEMGLGIRNPSGCSFSEPMFREIAQARIFSGTAAFANSGRVALSGNGPATMVDGQSVSGDFFRTLGIKAAAGRLLTAADDTPSAEPVVVLNYGYWQSAFGGSRDALGRTIELNGAAFTIVGVAEPRFSGITPGIDYDLWLPLSDNQRIATNGLFLRDDSRKEEANWWLTIIGRLSPEMPLPQAQAMASGLFRNQTLHGPAPLFKGGDGAKAPSPQPAAGNGSQAPAMDDDPKITLVPAERGLAGDRPQYANPLYVLMLAVGIILLIACANVAGLILARAAKRHQEMAVRQALGAGRVRIVRQLLTESLMLAILGGSLGVVFAYGIAHAIVSFLSSNQDRPFGFATGIDLRVLGFTIAISVLCGILFGVGPALRSTYGDVAPALKQGDASSVSQRHGRKWFSLGNGLVVAQVALAMVLLVGAGLLVRTLQNLRSVDTGFDAHNILIFNINPDLAGYKRTQLDSFYRDLQGRLSETPGVKSASYSMGPLLSGFLMATAFHWPGTPQNQQSEADALGVGPDFFQTLDIPVVAGRGFTTPDFETAAANFASVLAALNTGAKPPIGTPTPVIVNQAFVEKYLDKENPLGKRFGESAGDNESPPTPGYEIVGVVHDTKYNDLRREVSAMIFTPNILGGATFEVRTAAEPQAILPVVRKVVAQVNANLPLFNVHTQSEQIDRLLFQERLVARLASFFGLLALLLACVGLYGLLSYEVERRMREIGIRMALGAGAAHVLRMVIGQGITLAVVGTVVGMGIALGVTRYLVSMLYQVHAGDPLTLVAVAALLILVAFIACYIPARHALRVDPMVALRCE